MDAATFHCIIVVYLLMVFAFCIFMGYCLWMAQSLDVADAIVFDPDAPYLAKHVGLHTCTLKIAIGPDGRRCLAKQCVASL